MRIEALRALANIDNRPARKIAETLLKVGEKFSGFWYGFFRIERIGSARDLDVSPDRNGTQVLQRHKLESAVARSLTSASE